MKSILLMCCALAFCYAAQAQKKLRVYCLADQQQLITRFDTLQFQERWFRERSNTTSVAGRCMYFLAEWTAAKLDAENAEFDPHSGQNRVGTHTPLDKIEMCVSKIIFR